MEDNGSRGSRNNACKLIGRQALPLRLLAGLRVQVVRAESGETMGVCVEQLEFTSKEGAQDRLIKQAVGAQQGERLKTGRHTKVRQRQRSTTTKPKSLSAV